MGAENPASHCAWIPASNGIAGDRAVGERDLAARAVNPAAAGDLVVLIGGAADCAHGVIRNLAIRQRERPMIVSDSPANAYPGSDRILCDDAILKVQRALMVRDSSGEGSILTGGGGEFDARLDIAGDAAPAQRERSLVGDERTVVGL